MGAPTVAEATTGCLSKLFENRAGSLSAAGRPVLCPESAYQVAAGSTNSRDLHTRNSQLANHAGSDAAEVRQALVGALLCQDRR